MLAKLFRTVLRLFGFGLLCCCGVIQAEPIIPSATDNLVLWGKVVDDQGKAISGANVEWIPMTQFDNITSTFSDGGGNIFCPNPEARKKEDFVICRHPNFATWGWCHIKSKTYNADHPYEIKLSKGSSLELTIQSEDKKALSSANIWLERSISSDKDTHQHPQFEKLLSNAQGIATLPQLTKGALRVNVQKVGWVCPQKVSLEHTDKPSQRLITLQKAQNFEFNFIFPSKEASKNIKVIYAFSDNSIENLNQLKEDWFETEDSAEITRRIQAPKKGFLHFKTVSSQYREKAFNNIELKKIKAQSISLEKLIWIKGQVVDANTQKGLDKSSIHIRYKKDSSGRDSSQSIYSKKDGNFAHSLDLVGEVELSVWHQDYLLQEKTVKDTVELSELLFPLEKGDSMKFRLLQPIPYGEPAIISMRSFKVQLKTTKDKTYDLNLKSDQDGLCEISGLQNNDTLEFRLEGYLWQKIKVNFNGTVQDLLFTTATQTEITVLDENKTPLTGVYFRLSSNSNEQVVSSYDKTKQCYVIKTLPEEKIKLSVTKHKYKSGELEFETHIGTTSRQKIVLEPQTIYSIVLKNLTEAPPKTIEIRFSKDNNSSSQSPTLIKDSQPPRYEWVLYENESQFNTMQITVVGYLPVVRPFNEETKTYEIELTEGQQLEALVLDEMGTGIEGVSVSYSCPEYSFQLKAKSDSTGKVILKSLINSLYTLNLRKEGYIQKNLKLDLTQTIPTPTWTLSKGGQLVITVLSSQGLPAKDISVTLQQSNEWNGFQNTGNRSSRQKTDSEGQITFEGLAAGIYKASAKDDTLGLGSSEECEMKDGQTLHSQIILKEGLSIQGIVVDEDQKPLEKVQVYAYQISQNGGGEHANGTTDSAGQFKLLSLKEGTYQITLNHSDYESKAPQMQFEAGKNDLVLEMHLSKTISVVIKTPDNATPKKVTLYTRPELYKYENQIHRLSESEGKYQFKSNQLQSLGLNGQSFRLIAKSEGYNPGESDVYTTTSLLEEVSIALETEKSISFKLSNSMGESIQGVKVVPSQEAQGMFGGSSRSLDSAVSDDQGLATLKGLPEGTYIFTFNHSLYAATQKKLTISNTPLSVQSINLTKGAILKGIVKSSEGEVLKGAQVWIQTDSPLAKENTHSQLRATTDDAGAYIIQSIPPGDAEVYFNRKGIYTNRSNQKPARVALSEGETRTLDLLETIVENAGRVEVILSEYWSKIFNTVQLSKINFNMAGLRSKSSFQFENVPEGTYQLHLWGQQGKSKTKEVIVNADQTTTVTIDQEEKYQIIASVKDEDDQPILNGQAVLMPEGDSKNFFTNPYGSMAGTGRILNGKLEISLEQPGTYKLILYVQTGMQMRTVNLDSIQVVNEGVTDLGDIIVKEGAEIQGTVMSSSGEALQGVQITILKDGMPQFNPQWLSDKNGRFSLKNVPEPPFQLWANHPTMASLQVEVQSLSSLQLTMSSGVSVIVNLSGRSIANRRVILVNEDLSPVIGSLYNFRARNSLSNQEGQISLPQIAPGRYKIGVMGDTQEGSQYSELFDVSSSDVVVRMAVKD
jgi:protocatechuate 3,4-dioxygenase beta subunit